jgi:hypothetical protein
MNQRILKFWAALCCIGFLVQAHAQQLTKSARLAAPPTIDGIINDDEWKDANTFEGLHDENTGASYADGGKFWLGYDKNYIYFAARLTESEPNSIRATEYRTNVGLRGDDSVELDVDLSGSLSAFNSLVVEPRNVNGLERLSLRGTSRPLGGSARLAFRGKR